MKILKKNIKTLKILTFNIFAVLVFFAIFHFLKVIDLELFLNIKLFLMIFAVFFFSSFFLFFEFAEVKLQEKIKNFFKKFFPFVLILQVANSFLTAYPIHIFEQISKYGVVFFGIFLMFVVLMLIVYRKEKFEKFKDINTKTAIILLILIIILFTFVKAPYFEKSFTGPHTMKYNAHVEPAKYMYEKSDPFWMQRKYQSDPVNNPQGIIKSFEHPPLHEWGLFAMFKLFENNSLELNTRLFTHFLGILILIFSYILFTKWLTKIQSLIIVLLLAINPIINFLSFVTVDDSWLIIFTLLSLIFLTKFIKNNSYPGLFWSGVFFGIGCINKISISLWLFPIIATIIALNPTKFTLFLRNLSIIVFLTLLVFIAFKTSLAYLPTNPLTAILTFIFWLLIFVLIYYLFKKYEKYLVSIVEFIWDKKLLFTSLIIIAAIPFFILYSRNLYYFEEFLTDSQLIFNLDMYYHMLNEQFKNYMTSYIFYLGILGFMFFLLFSREKNKQIILAFLIGSIVFWVLASKVIFFHDYYTGIIMFAFSISVGLLFNFLTKIYRQNFLILLLLLIMSFPIAYKANTDRLNTEKDIKSLKQVADFLLENTSEEEIYIDDSYLLTLTIMTGRPRIEESALIQEEIIDSIEEIGFSKTMDKYNVVYLITANTIPKYENYVNLFTRDDLDTISYRRSELVLLGIGQVEHYFSDIQTRKKIISENRIKEKFILEKEFGPYRVFSFRD